MGRLMKGKSAGKPGKTRWLCCKFSGFPQGFLQIFPTNPLTMRLRCAVIRCRCLFLIQMFLKASLSYSKRYQGDRTSVSFRSRKSTCCYWWSCRWSAAQLPCCLSHGKTSTYQYIWHQNVSRQYGQPVIPRLVAKSGTGILFIGNVWFAQRAIRIHLAHDQGMVFK